MTTTIPEIFGSNPANPQWQVVRGDTEKIRVEFYQPDETTLWDTSDWEFTSTTYNASGEVVDQLEVIVYPGYIEIIASSAITSTWGNNQQPISARLAFDVQVVINGEVWTPILGTISVLSDVTINN